MRRLTTRKHLLGTTPLYACYDVQCSFDCDNCNINKLIQRLCEYEDTGMTPEEIEVVSKKTVGDMI